MTHKKAATAQKGAKGTQAAGHSSKATGRGEKLKLGPSCAGCRFNEMGMAEGSFQKGEGPTLFNHFCLNPDFPGFDIVPLHLLTPLLMPPQPEGCGEERPSITI